MNGPTPNPQADIRRMLWLQATLPGAATTTEASEAAPAPRALPPAPKPSTPVRTSLTIRMPERDDAAATKPKLPSQP